MHNNAIFISAWWSITFGNRPFKDLEVSVWIRDKVWIWFHRYASSKQKQSSPQAKRVFVSYNAQISFKKTADRWGKKSSRLLCWIQFLSWGKKWQSKKPGALFFFLHDFCPNAGSLTAGSLGSAQERTWNIQTVVSLLHNLQNTSDKPHKRRKPTQPIANQEFSFPRQALC